MAAFAQADPTAGIAGVPLPNAYFAMPVAGPGCHAREPLRLERLRRFEPLRPSFTNPPALFFEARSQHLLQQGPEGIRQFLD